MIKTRPAKMAYQVLKIGGVRYAVLPESAIKRLLSRTGPQMPEPPSECPGEDDSFVNFWDPEAIARHLMSRRKRAHFTQAELARRASVRIETSARFVRMNTPQILDTLSK